MNGLKSPNSVKSRKQSPALPLAPTTMNSSTSASQSMSSSALPTTTSDAAAAASGKKVRKPYTITKSRESWTEEEHDKFLEALQLFDRDWKKIEDFIGSKTVIQIRSHAQKYFLKVQKNGAVAHVPPPRPKRKAAHPYPQKAPKNVLAPVQAAIAHPSSVTAYIRWDDSSILRNPPSDGVLPSHDEFNLQGLEDGATDMNNSNISGVGTSCRTLPSSEIRKQGEQASLLPGIPDFSEVYSFIGSVFDPSSGDHVERLKEMDPINFETISLLNLYADVLLLMRNLTVNLSSPDFEPIKGALSSYDINTNCIGGSAGNIVEKLNNDLPC